MIKRRRGKQQREGVGLESIKPSPRGSLIVLGVFAGLAVVAVVLMLLYRQMPKATEVLDKKKRAEATHVAFAVVFSNVEAQQRERVIREIVEDIGADSAKTDLVIGSTIADPWCSNIAEYKRQLRRAMTESSQISIGKQTLLFSMITGLIVKDDLPARVYLIGDINSEEVSPKTLSAVKNRTIQTVSALAWRNKARAPVTVISYVDSTASAINAEYMHLFTGQTFSYVAR